MKGKNTKVQNTWQSQNQNGVYMWIAREIIVKTARNFHFRTKNSLKWMILESRQRKRKVVQLNYILSFIFNFVLCIIYVATFRNSVAQAHTEHSNLNFWWPWSVLTRHWRPCDRQFLALHKPILFQFHR